MSACRIALLIVLWPRSAYGLTGSEAPPQAVAETNAKKMADEQENIAELLVKTSARAGVSNLYGVAGDSLNGITDSIRARGDLRWVHVRHEEAAAFAAGAEAHLTGRLAVCAGSCGPGTLPLTNGLYGCHRSRVPVLASACECAVLDPSIRPG